MRMQLPLTGPRSGSATFDMMCPLFGYNISAMKVDDVCMILVVAGDDWEGRCRRWCVVVLPCDR
jgi:hypothetical protein